MDQGGSLGAEDVYDGPFPLQKGVRSASKSRVEGFLLVPGTTQDRGGWEKQARGEQKGATNCGSERDRPGTKKVSPGGLRGFHVSRRGPKVRHQAKEGGLSVWGRFRGTRAGSGTNPDKERFDHSLLQCQVGNPPSATVEKKTKKT